MLAHVVGQMRVTADRAAYRQVVGDAANRANIGVGLDGGQLMESRGQ
jgi:hypothetical protein